jgi:hypothetical protein
MVEGGGFEPPKLSRQIYSLIPLTAREPLHFCGAKFCQRAYSMSTSNINRLDKTPELLSHSGLAFDFSNSLDIGALKVWH